MKTLHLAPAHATFDTRVFLKECRTLAAAGHEVVLAVRHDRAEVVDGVRIVPLPAWPNRLARFVGNPWRCLRVARRERPDVVHLHDAEVLLVGTLLALLGWTVVLDSHEDYPRLARDRSWIPRPLRRVASAAVTLVERLATPPLAAVISAEDEGARRFRHPRVRVIRNHVLADEFGDDDGRVWADRERRLVYVGAITPERGAVEMVDCLERLDDDVRLSLLGTIGVPALSDRLRARPTWTRVDAPGFADRATVAAELARSRAAFVLWHPTSKHAEGAVPVKLFEYLAAGVPVVASDFPEIRAVVEAADAGLLVDPLDGDAVAAAVRTLLADDESAAAMGKRGREYVLAHHTWEAQAPILLDLYADLAAERVGEERR